MAGEIELERMLVRLVGDGTQYKAMLQQAAEQSNAAGKAIGGGLAPAEHAGGKLALSMRDSRHAIHLLGAVTGLEGVTRPAMMGVYAWHLFEHSIHGVTAALGTMGTAFAATGLGVAIAGVAVAVHYYEKFQEVQKAAKESAGKMWGEVISGAKDAKQALQEVRPEALEAGFKKLTEETLNPGWMKYIWEGILQTARQGDVGEQKKLSEGIDQVMQKAQRAQEILTKMTKTRPYQEMAETAARERIPAKAEAEVDKLERARELAGLSEDEAKREGFILDLMKQGNMTREGAIGRLGTMLDRMKELQESMRLDKYEQDLSKALEHSRYMAGAVGVEKDARERIAKFAEDAKISYKEAEKLVGEGTRGTQQQIAQRAVRDAMDQQVRDLEKQAALGAKVGTDAELLKMAYEYVDKLGLDRTAENLAKGLEEAKGHSQAIANALNQTGVNKLAAEGRKTADEYAALVATLQDGEAAGIRMQHALELLAAAPEGTKLSDIFEKNGAALDAFTEKAMRLKGLQLFQETLTPLEKFANKLRDLDLMLQKGYISEQTYNRAVMESEKQLGLAAKAAGKFDAAAYGSADFFTRLQDYADTMRAPEDAIRQARNIGSTSPVPAAGAGGAEGMDREKKNADNIQNIRENIAKMAARPGVGIEKAGLN
jgi:hypothetical protein